ncbi:MAG: cell division protein FtsA [Pseudomonadota bacterium]|nr:cell division protein FtsA [Pseudomonadota bacterium]
MSVKNKNAIVAGLDIGSSKVCCFIAELDEFFNPRVLGYGQYVTAGMKRGVIIDMDQIEHAIRESVAQAEDMAGVDVEEVYVSLGGVHLKSQMTDGLVVLNNHEIDDNDIVRVIEVARAKQIEGDRQIVYAQATKYLLDSQNDIRDPRGMTGSRLESEVHIISAASSAVRNVLRCVERADLEVAELVVQPYASGLSSLVQDEKELGVCLVDIGGGTSDIAIFGDGALLYSGVIPVGGHHITNDIARGLSTPLSHAERIKTMYGCAMSSMVSGDETIDIPHVGENDGSEPGHVTKSVLAGIIQPRCEEILEMIREKIEQSGFESSIGRRVVITGGTSQLEGVRQLAEVILDKNVRIARPVALEGLTDLSGGAQFSTAAGLVVYGARQYAAKARASRRVNVGKGFWSGVTQSIRQVFQSES